MKKYAAIPRTLMAASIFLLLYLSSLYRYLLFHSLVEIFSIIVASCIFLLTWNARKFLDNHYLMVIGISFLFIGTFDLIHMLSYRGMGVFEGYDTNLPTQTWVIARYFQAISFLIAPFFIHRRFEALIQFSFYTILSVFLIACVFYWDIFPACFIEGVGLTSFKIISEYIICLILVVSAILLGLNRNAFDHEIFYLLMGSIFFTIVSELTFTLYAGVYDMMNMAGHFLKVIAFYLIYKALVRNAVIDPYSVLFKNLKESEAALRKSHQALESRVEERTAELLMVNKALELENEERKHVENELRKNEELMRTVLETLPVGVWVIDPQGRITMSNPASREIWGGQPPAGMGRFDEYKARWVHSGKQIDPAESAVSRAVAKGETTFNEMLEIEGFDGSQKIILNSAVPILGEEQRVVAAIIVNQDITLQRRAEEEREQYTHKLEQSNKDLQEFAFVASHDLQEPLRKIQTFGSLLKNEYAEVLDRQGADYLKRMGNAAERMQTLILDLLSLSRVTTEAASFSKVDLKDLTNDVLADLEVRILETGALVEIGSLGVIDADRRQMRQLFQNLIGNSLKFHGSEKPIIKVHGRPIPLPRRPGTRRHNPGYEIRVEDNGIGFDEKNIERIFMPFQRLHGRMEYEGTGMGLAICRKIVERHGGTITAKSKPEKGSTFIITLPLQQNEKPGKS